MTGNCSQPKCYPEDSGCNIEGCINLSDCKYYGKKDVLKKEDKQDIENDINPFVPFDDSVHHLEQVINKRMDAVEAILRRIETEQTKPTKKLLDRLFNQQEEEQPKFVERKTFHSDSTLYNGRIKKDS